MARNNTHRDFKNDAFEPLAYGLGLVALSYNDLLISLGSLFDTIMKIPNKLITSTVWHAIRSDRDQVELIGKLGSSKASGISIPVEIRKEIQWVKGRVVVLIDVRNDLLHSPFVISGGRPVPLHLGTHQRALKFDRKDPVRECEWFYDAATVVRDWTDDLEASLTQKRFTLGQRPKWPPRPN